MARSKKKKKITGNIWIGGQAAGKYTNWQNHTKVWKHDLTKYDLVTIG